MATSNVYIATIEGLGQTREDAIVAIFATPEAAQGYADGHNAEYEEMGAPVRVTVHPALVAMEKLAAALTW